MIWSTALRLANENRRLRREVRDLQARLLRSTVECERLHVTLQRVTRDAQLLGLMARDRQVALEFLRTAHDIDNQQEAS